MENYAVLSNSGNYTIFAYGPHTIRFKTSSHLEKYTKVLEWDDGYLVVMAKYDNMSAEEEDYIDLVPILQNLYFDTDSFFKQIKDVRIQNV